MVAVALSMLIATHAAQAPLPLIPQPLSLERLDGTYKIPPKFTISCDPEFKRVAEILVASLRKDHKISASIVPAKPSAKASLLIEKGDVATLSGSESYSLEVEPNGIRVRAPKSSGAFYGTQTLRQLVAANPGSIPCLQIADEPRFSWRGLHLDVSRHFFNKKEILKYLDTIADLKLNVFHWHLTDDGGWRMEVPKFPMLTEVGAWRTQRPGEVWDYTNIEFPGKDSKKKLYGGFYTQKEIREVVQYAADRGIAVVPEIEMPGHCQPALIACPEVTCNVDKVAGRAYRTTAFCPGKEATFEFLQGVLDQTMALFPSKIIHIGGDEVDKYDWARCPDCQARIKSEGLKDVQELQSYFVKRIEKYLNSKGRTLMGWDEILEGGLAPNAMVMSWRGIAGGIAAAKSGHEVVMSPTSHCYFDYGYDGTSTEHVYGFEPVPLELTGDQAKLVLGGQANVWTEWMADFKRVETMIYPRIYAMAETLWTPPTRKDFGDFSERLGEFYPQLVSKGISFYVGPPTADTGLIMFKDECSVTFRAVSIPGLELRYTLDGTAPSGTSPIVTGPIRVTKDATVTAARVRNGKADPEMVRVMCRTSLPSTTPTPVKCALYEGAFAALPDFSKLGTGKPVPNTDLSITPFLASESFALRWQGTLEVKTEGIYTFTLGSDDGSMLWIAGVPVVDNNRAQPYTERSGRAMLVPGVYSFELGYFQGGGACRFASFVEGPDLPKGEFLRIVSR